MSGTDYIPEEVYNEYKVITLTSLDILLIDIEASKALLLDHFGKISRIGWFCTHSVYCRKFSISTSLL